MEQKRQGGTRRGGEKHSVVGYIQEKMVVVEKIRPKDRQRYWSQLKRLVKPVGAKP